MKGLAYPGGGARRVLGVLCLEAAPMQLVDAGRPDLVARVRRCVTEFRLAPSLRPAFGWPAPLRAVVAR
jgi:hypothetical protein